MAEDAASSASVTAVATSAIRERSIVYRGAITVQVKDLLVAEQELLTYVKQVKGYVESSSTSNLEGSVRRLDFTLRIPVKQFDEAMGIAGNLGIVSQKRISSEDITSQIVDLDARLRVMRAQEASYLKILEQAKLLKDSIAVQEKLMQLRSDIESMDATLRAQRELADLSTLNVTLVTEAKPINPNQRNSWFNDTWVGATERLMGTVYWLGRFAVYGLVFAPVWLPVAGIIWWLRRRKKVQQTKVN